jgi:hypothetical protein
LLKIKRTSSLLWCLGMLPNQEEINTCCDFTPNPSTWEAEAGASRVLGQPGLHIMTLSQKGRKKEGREGGRGD